MKQPINREEMASVRALALNDLQATTDSELREELMADGQDIKVVAARVRARIDEAASAVLRAQAEKARAIKARSTTLRPTPTIRPVIDRLKEMVQSALLGRPDLAVAFRDGKKQSDSDWETLYDDLVALGVIKIDLPNNDH